MTKSDVNKNIELTNTSGGHFPCAANSTERTLGRNNLNLMLKYLHVQVLGKQLRWMSRSLSMPTKSDKLISVFSTLPIKADRKRAMSSQTREPYFFYIYPQSDFVRFLLQIENDLAMVQDLLRE